jgi:hypothetical protein
LPARSSSSAAPAVAGRERGAVTAGADAVVVSTEAVVAARKDLRFEGMMLPQELCL